jgi:hypothetical protein
LILLYELAAECGCTAEELLIELAAMKEFTLGPDSPVRDSVAKIVREKLQRPSEDSPSVAAEDPLRSQLERLRDKLAGVSDVPPPVVRPVSNQPWHQQVSRPARRPTGRHWRPGDDPLNVAVRALADQIVRNNYDRSRKPAGIIYFDELSQAKEQHRLWVKASIERGYMLGDEAIAGWVKAFLDKLLDPSKILPLAEAGLSPRDAALRLWYGQFRLDRPTMLDQILFGDITPEKATDAIAKY